MAERDTVEWLAVNELQAWTRLIELARKLTHEPGFLSAQRDAWITADGSLREGLALRFALTLGGPAVIRVGLEYRDEDDEPEPFGDYYEPE